MTLDDLMNKFSPEEGKDPEIAKAAIFISISDSIEEYHHHVKNTDISTVKVDINNPGQLAQKIIELAIKMDMMSLIQSHLMYLNMLTSAPNDGEKDMFIKLALLTLRKIGEKTPVLLLAYFAESYSGDPYNVIGDWRKAVKKMLTDYLLV